MNNDRIWFANNGANVIGPFTSTELIQHSKSFTGTMVWGPGLTAWISFLEWKEKPNLDLARAYFLDHERHIPRTLNEIIDLITPSTHLQLVRFWLPVAGRSVSLFEVPEVCNAMGLPLRQQVRSKIEGTLILQKEGVRVSIPTETISANGVGARIGNNITFSGEVLISLRSEQLSGIEPTEATVLYNHNGSIGLRFNQLEPKSKNRIIEFVNSRQVDAA